MENQLDHSQQGEPCLQRSSTPVLNGIEADDDCRVYCDDFFHGLALSDPDSESSSVTIASWSPSSPGTDFPPHWDEEPAVIDDSPVTFMPWRCKRHQHGVEPTSCGRTGHNVQENYSLPSASRSVSPILFTDFSDSEWYHGPSSCDESDDSEVEGVTFLLSRMCQTSSTASSSAASSPHCRNFSNNLPKKMGNDQQFSTDSWREHILPERFDSEYFKQNPIERSKLFTHWRCPRCLQMQSNADGLPHLRDVGHSTFQSSSHVDSAGSSVHLQQPTQIFLQPFTSAMVHVAPQGVLMGSASTSGMCTVSVTSSTIIIFPQWTYYVQQYGSSVPYYY